MGLPRGPRRRKQCATNGIASTPVASKSSSSPPAFGEESPIHHSPSPVPFLCTQDGSNGENDVVWNFNSPDTLRVHKRIAATPIRKRNEIVSSLESSPVSSVPLKKRLLRQSASRKEYFHRLKEELSVLNKHVQNIENIVGSKEKPKKESSPILPYKLHIKCNTEAIESDDSMNEQLFKASQILEEKIEENCDKLTKLDSVEKYSNNDSFDQLVLNINDSYIEVLSQRPAAKKESFLFEGSFGDVPNFSKIETPTTKKTFNRHNSMPESPSNVYKNKAGASSPLVRHNSMPVCYSNQKVPGCSQQEIMKKREAAMEKLLLKKQIVKPSDKSNNIIQPLKEINIQDVIKRKREEALQKLQKKKQLLLNKSKNKR